MPMNIYPQLEQKHADMVAGARFMGINIPTYNTHSGCYESLCDGSKWDSNCPDSWKKNWKKMLPDLHKAHSKVLKRPLKPEYHPSGEEVLSKEKIAATLICYLSSGSGIYQGSIECAEQFNARKNCLRINLGVKLADGESYTSENTNIIENHHVILDDEDICGPYLTTKFPVSLGVLNRFIRAIGIAIIAVQSRKNILITCKNGNNLSSLFTACFLICLDAIGHTSPFQFDGNTWDKIACSVYGFVSSRCNIAQTNDTWVGFYWAMAEILPKNVNTIVHFADIYLHTENINTTPQSLSNHCEEPLPLSLS